MNRIATALVLTLLASPALADAVTYKGTIGDLPIVLELSEEPHAGNADLFGRYFYVNKGVDIPFHAAPAARSRFGLAEEVACSADTNNCPGAQDDPPGPAPLGARWALEISRDGQSLEGHFAINGRNRPVRLERVGTRLFDPAGGTIALPEFANSLYWDGTLTPETSPYDYLKVTAVKLAASDPVEMNGASFHYVTDPRTKFRYPRLLDMSGYDIAPANAWLERRHWIMTLDALSCMAQQYQGFGWNGYNYDAGTLGWYDEEQVTVDYASSTVLSWTQSGSLSCGGAHPYNHIDIYNLDLVDGVPLDLSRIFRGWRPLNYDGTPADLETARANPRDYQWLPDAELATFVKEHRRTDAEMDVPSGEDGCPIDELIDTNLAIGFKDGDRVVFTLGGLPHVIFACTAVLYETPILDIAWLLTNEAENYFPSLAD
ncbi:MAG: hypothetical protein EOP22_08635 [Hyphomicrobiales bacterium]|nr:MAG: hypothetical protein EOP22_08635 [Hyphomicrobiales bacterium]